MKTYQVYNLNTGKVCYETQHEDLLVNHLKLNSISFLAPEYGYFSRKGHCYTVIDKENDFDVTEEIITKYFEG